MIDRAYPANRGETPIKRELIEPEPFTQHRERHTFRSAGYIVLLHHRGIVIDRLCGYIDTGRYSAIEDARRRTTELRIEPTDELAVTVVRRVQEYERTYVGMGKNPALAPNAPELIPFYEGHPRNYRTIEADVVWSSLPALAGNPPIPAFLWGCRFIQGD